MQILYCRIYCQDFQDGLLADKTILETQEDIEQYLSALRSSMEKIINNGNRIQITGK